MTFRGIGVSPGVAIGKVVLVREAVAARDYSIEAGEEEIARLERAVILTRIQLKELQSLLQRKTSDSESAILDAHVLVLDDHLFMDAIIRQILEKKRNAESVILDVTAAYARLLDGVGDAYLKERVGDVKDVARRLIANLTGSATSVLAELSSPCILAAPELSPSETAGLSPHSVLALATDMGSATSHTAVLARALEIPAVVALGMFSTVVKDGDEALVDGTRGLVILSPTKSDIEEYGRLTETRRKIVDELLENRDRPAKTRDGRGIHLMANAECVMETDSILKYGAEGIGLFRSEYLFLAKGKPLDENEQAAKFEALARRMAPKPVVIRTLDLGGDKLMPGFKNEHEPNPFLGLRSIRFCLKHPDYFKGHLRAILRATVFGNVSIMYPMVCKAEELAEANELVEICMTELRREGIPFDPNVRKGAMIEVPSAALTVEEMAKHVDFFSLGTNDLTQYTLAVDRVNEKVAYLYNPLDPAVLMLIDRACRAAREAGIPIGLCGEMGADPVLAPLLVGMELDSLSMAPSAVPLVKDVVRSVKFEETKALAKDALSCTSAATVRDLCLAMIRETAPEIIEML